MTDPTSAAPSKPQGTVAGALFLAVLTAALDIAMVIPAIPVIGESFGLTARGVAWVYAVFTLSNLAGVPIMGWLADNFGRRLVLLSDIALFIAGAVVVALAPNYGVLLVGRGIQGMAAAGIFPVVASIVGDIYPGRLRGRVLGMLGSVFGVAFIVGPPLSGILLQTSWRLVFALVAPLGLLSILLIRSVVPRSRRDIVRPSFDAAGLTALVGMVLALAVALNNLDAESLLGSMSRFPFWGPLIILAVLIPLFVLLERSAVRPVVRLSLFTNRDVRIAVLIAVGAGFCEAAMVFTPYYAGEVFGVDRSTASYMFVPLALAVALGSPVLGRMIDRAGVRAVVSAACVSLLLGLGGLAASSASLALFYLGSIGVGLGLAGLLGSALNYIMLGATVASERATSQGFVTLALNMGLSLGAAVVGAIVSSSATAEDGFRLAFLSLSALALVLLVLSFGLRRHDPAQAS